MGKNFLNIFKTKNILIELVIVFFVTIFLTFFILKVYNMHLRLPMSYGGDALFLGYIFKTIHEFGWWSSKNLNVGLPFGSSLYDYSSFYFDSIHFFIAKIIMFFVKDWGKTINIFYLSLFPLTSLISYYVMRKLKISIFISFWGSLCYTFLSYRFERISHLFLSSYYLIPLLVLLYYILYIDEEVLVLNKKFFKNKKNIYILLLLIVLSLSGIYYSFFSCFFIFITLFSKFKKNNIGIYLKKIFICYITVALTMTIIYIPNIIVLVKQNCNIY